MRITEYMVNRHAEAVRLANAKTAIATAIESKGVTVPDGTKLDGMAALVEAISAGGDGLTAVTGEYTPAEKVTGFEITHNLGKIPSCAGYIPYQSDVTFTGKLIAVCGLYVNGVSYCYCYNGGSVAKPWTGAATYDITTGSPPTYPSNCYFVSVWGATAKTIQFGNANAASASAFLPQKYMWFVMG